MASFSDGVLLFNERRSKEAHEAWEGLWRPLPPSLKKDFLKGLILVAVGFFHYQRHQYRGTRKALGRAIFLLNQSKEEAAGIDADNLIRLVTQFYEALLADERSLSDDNFPCITLHASP
jgi:predicted metal-dependent hydrolase